MRDFITWIKETKGAEQLEAPQEQPVEKEEGKEATNEDSTRRAGVRSHAYPPAYSRGQYPDLALTPGVADGAFYLSKAHDKK